MKILFITDNFPPEVNAPATRTYEHCKHWVEAGEEVTVITCAPNFPRGKVFEGYRNKLYQREMIDGIKVVRVWSYMSANEGFAKRILDYLSFAFMAFWAGLFRRTDIIIATSPQFFTTLTGFGLSLFKRKPWVFELRDLWPESVAAVGAMKHSKALKVFERMEMFMYRRADLIVPLTPAFKQSLASRGIDGVKIRVVTNGANMALFTARPKDVKLLDQLGLKGKFVVGYIGTHGMAHSLNFVIRTIAQLKDNSVHFLFIGDGAEKESILSLAKELDVQNATFLDSIPKESVPVFLSIVDAVLVPLRKSETFKTVIPSKIFEAAAMEKPIILGVDGQAREIIEGENAGIYFEPENAQELLEVIARLSSDPSLRSDLVEGCRRLAKKYNRSVLADNMLSHLKSFDTPSRSERA